MMQEIKRYRCIKARSFELCDDDGYIIDGEYKIIEVGSIWQESLYMIAGGPDNIHLDREDGQRNTAEWCEPLRDDFCDYFEKIESIYA